MSSKKKELTVQETFYNLCKDLIRYIDKKIVRKYVSPNQAQIPKEKRIKEKQYDDNRWRYFFEDEETTNEERIKDIFKDNNFLSHLQILYNDLNVLIKNMEENKTNQENLNKKFQMADEKMKMSGEINTQLLKYFMKQNKNLGCINQDDIIKALEELKNNDSNNNLNSEIIQQYINNINKTQIKNNSHNSEKEYNKELTNITNINNDWTKKENNKIEIDKQINKNTINNLTNNKVIPNLIQAFDILNKNKKQKMKQAKKIKLMKNIFDSDSSDSNNEKDEESDEEEEEDDKEGIKEKDKKFINKYNYENNEKEKEKNFLNKKVKRYNN